MFRFILDDDKNIVISQSKSWLMMTWRRQEPGHQQTWFWPSCLRMIYFLLEGFECTLHYWIFCICIWTVLGPVLLTIFPAQLKFCGNNTLLSNNSRPSFYWYCLEIRITVEKSSAKEVPVCDWGRPAGTESVFLCYEYEVRHSYKNSCNMLWCSKRKFPYQFY